MFFFDTEKILCLYSYDHIILMFTQWWLIVKKKEMTRVLINDKMTPVTIVQLVPQKVIRHKTQEKDGYDALIVGVVGKKDTYLKQKEFNISSDLLATFPAWYVFGDSFLEGLGSLAVQGVSKGKGFQWVIKRHHMSGMPATHGHKFRRSWWSKGNRKPRRWFKWHPHAGHMGSEVTTLKNAPLLQKLSFENETLLVFKGSLPGAYNSFLYLYK